MRQTGLTQAQRQEVMQETLADPVLFCRTFLSHWFPLPLSWAHRGMMALLLRQTDFLLNFGPEVWGGVEYRWTEQDLEKILKFYTWKEEPDNPNSPEIPLFSLREAPGQDAPVLDLATTSFTQIMWPRGFGKTTTVNAVNLIKVVFKLKQFLVYLSETATHANQQLANIKRELEDNALLIQVFGNLKPDRTESNPWREDIIETKTGVVLVARGRGGQVRGLNHRAKRPDEITVDDVEDKESVQTPEQRKKTRVWFKADVEPALNQVLKGGHINMLGTILHREALMPTLQGDPEWITIRFGAMDPEGAPIWPQYMDKEGFEKKKLGFARAGMLAEFYMEYQSQLVNSETAKFKPPFKYQIMERKDFVAVSLVIDPAISETIDADFCAFAVTGMTERGQHHVIEAVGRRGMSPREQVDTYFDLHFRYEPTHHGVESIAYQAALVHLLREEMFRRAKTWGARAYFEITPIKGHRTAKIPRVEGILAPRYSSGYISHQKVFPELEQQLLDWPNAKLDFPDAVAMAITLLDPYAALAFDTTELEDGMPDSLARDHYEPLEVAWSAP